MFETKKVLTFEEIEAQTALALPARETPVTVIIGCVAVCVGRITIQNIDVDLAATVCAQVLNINALFGQTVLFCRTRA